MKIIIALVVVFSAYFILNIVRVILKKLLENNLFIRKTNQLSHILEPTIWAVVGFGLTKYLFQGETFYNLIITISVVIISVLIGWFFIKDFIAGIIFKIQNTYTKGDYLQIGDLSGQLESMLLTHISVLTKDGRILKVPYSKVSNEIILERTKKKTYEDFTFTLSTNKKENIKNTENAIHNLLLASPWLVNNSQLSVTFVEEIENNYKFEIQVQVRNSNHLENLKEGLSKRFDK